ncbi:MAG: shikimate dehydrogenase [Burkholderiaceae bacterium]
MNAPRYAVVGNPVAHSLSPDIHAAFARETGLAVDYRRIVAPVDGFASSVDAFFADGGRGVNVTVPFKLEACAYCGDRISPRARRAGAVNFIAHETDGAHGDNTDGIGLVTDLARLAGGIGARLSGSRILLVGAGGAARGVLGPLLDAKPQSLCVVGRDRSKVDALIADTPAEGRGFDEIGTMHFDLVINATSASLSGDRLSLPSPIFEDAAIAYDMMYAAAPTSFMVDASAGGTRRVADGLGMLVEQAAESFFLWRGVRPQTGSVIAMLRARLADAR